jgi:hypothetical protein
MAAEPTSPPAVPPVTADVAATLAGLDASRRALVHRLRALVQSAAPDAVESVKWNAPSFALAQRHFATLTFRGGAGLRLVLHLGAAAQPQATVRAVVPDPGNRLTWKSADRAVASIAGPGELDACHEQLGAIVHAWAGYVRGMA